MKGTLPSGRLAQSPGLGEALCSSGGNAGDTGARSLVEQLISFSSSWEWMDLSPLGLLVPTVLQGEQSDAWEVGRGGESCRELC